MTAWTFLLAALLLIVGYLAASGFFRVWQLYRGPRIITCPENDQPAAVKVDALSAAKWTAIAGETPLRLSSCSRWPEMAGCGQECLSQVESSPVDCAVKTIVTKWYAGKSCVFCQEPIGTIVWHERPPALRAPDGTTREWKDIPAEDLSRVFATHSPVCWPCHICESFRHDHEELVIDRPPHGTRHAAINPSYDVY